MTTKLEVNCLIFVAQNGIDHPKSLAIGRWFASRGKQRLMWQFFDGGGAALIQTKPDQHDSIVGLGVNRDSIIPEFHLTPRG